MVLKVKTATSGTIVQPIKNSLDAVNILRGLAAEGIKCIRWEVVRNVD